MLAKSRKRLQWSLVWLASVALSVSTSILTSEGKLRPDGRSLRWKRNCDRKRTGSNVKLVKFGTELIVDSWYFVVD